MVLALLIPWFPAVLMTLAASSIDGQNDLSFGMSVLDGIERLRRRLQRECPGYLWLDLAGIDQLRNFRQFVAIRLYRIFRRANAMLARFFRRGLGQCCNQYAALFQQRP